MLGRDDSNKPKVGMSSAPETKGHEPRRASIKPQQADSLRTEQNRGLFALETAADAAAAAKSPQSCPTLCNPIGGSHQAPPSLGFSRQEYWSGVPSPSPVHASETEMYSKSEK